MTDTTAAPVAARPEAPSTVDDTAPENDHGQERPAPGVTLKALKEAVEAGTVETVLLAMTDMQGRLQGKRMSARHFLQEVAEHGAEACNYLLAVDVEMNTVDGYELASWDGGYGDFVLRPDLTTLRHTPWDPGTVICLADVHGQDGAPVCASPRQILRTQLERLAALGYRANAATELEFMLFRTSYEQAWQHDYRELEPANLYNVDYSVLGTARVEPVMRRIRREMEGAGLYVEDSKGECNRGQHEINFRYASALTTADNHAIYKTGAKAIAAQEDMSITFMAKYDEREGNSCHIHLSLTRPDGSPVFADEPDVLYRLLAGVLTRLREFTLLLAPNINSYKRFARGSFAPTAVAWGYDNRTCSLRVVGHGAGRRVECRVAGGDVNPYLAIAALVAAGIDGIQNKLAPPPATDGNAYAAEAAQVPNSLREAHDLFADSEAAREAFGEAVVAHYLNAARIELDAFATAVTDWERRRGFERL